MISPDDEKAIREISISGKSRGTRMIWNCSGRWLHPVLTSSM